MNHEEKHSKVVDDLMDKVDEALDQDKEDEKVMGRLKHPYVKWAFSSLIVLLFLIFATYFISFIFRIPLPESKLLEVIMSTIVEVMKILLPG